MRIATCRWVKPRRDVSLSSGCLIANTLLENGHEVLLLII